MAEALIFQRLRDEVPNARQIEFFNSTVRHTAYGGARGGGKSWSARRKAVLLAMNYKGLRILLIRRSFPELNENHILPLRAELEGFAKYNTDERSFTFPNGSRIKCGYCDTDNDVFQYQGQEYDVIFLEECTQLTEFQMNFFTTCNRSVRTDFHPRMYYTGNPGGPGHQWFKRLFIDKLYQKKERPEDYVFIPARVYDNTVLMGANPEYVEALENLPDELREAHLNGNWDIFVGQYFTEFRRDIHVVKPRLIPAGWRRYFVLDYGLDMLAAYWIAMDPRGRAIFYREVYKKGLRVGQVIDEIRKAEQPGEVIYERIAPPDLFARNDQTGRSPVEVWADAGLYFTRSKNDRVQGWYDMKEWLAPYEDEQSTPKNPIWTANLLIAESCLNLIRCLPLLQHAEQGDPNDVSKDPHEISHGPDACRYFVCGRPVAAVAQKKHVQAVWEEDMWEDYERASEADKAMMIERWGNPYPMGA